MVVIHAPRPARRRPCPVAQCTVEAGDHPERVEILAPVALPELDRAATPGGDVDAERVVNAVLADGDGVGRNGRAHHRHRSEGLLRRAVDVRRLEESASLTAQIHVAGREQLDAARRRQQVVRRVRVVGHPGIPDVVVPAGRLEVVPRQRANRSQRGSRHRTGAVGSLVRKREPALRPRRGVAARDPLPIRVRRRVEVVAVGDLRPLARSGEGLLLVLQGRREEHAAFVTGGTGRGVDVVGLRVAIRLRDAGVAADLGAVVALAEDDVDHSGDGVRSIDRRGAVLQHLDALDRGVGDGVQVGRRVCARAARNHAAAVDEHQRAGRAEAAECDADRAVVPVVHLRVDGVALLRQRLEEIADGDAAGGLDLIAADDGDGRRRVQVFAADAGSSDDDLFARGLLRARGRSARDGGLDGRSVGIGCLSVRRGLCLICGRRRRRGLRGGHSRSR